MQHTVVGVFDSVAEAQKAAAELAAKGVARDRIQVSQQAAAGTTTQSGATRIATGDDDGILSHIKHFFADLFGEDEEAHSYAEAVRRGGAIVKVDVDGDNDQLECVTDALDDAGAVDIEERSNQWRAEGWTGSSASSAARPGPSGAAVGASAQTVRSARAEDEESDVIPVIDERVEVGKRSVGMGAVRVYAHTVTTPVNEAVVLRSEHAEIERRPVDRPATEADLNALGDKTIEVRETAEKPVVSKTARVVEEVSVGKRVEQHEERVADSVRHTEVNVERTAEDRSFANYDRDFRADFQTRYGASGESYADYEPAYRFGHALRTDARYRNRQWNDFEGDARRDWETRNPGSAWEKVKAAVRHAWERVTD